LENFWGKAVFNRFNPFFQMKIDGIVKKSGNVISLVLVGDSGQSLQEGLFLGQPTGQGVKVVFLLVIFDRSPA
jgi:Tfp pilus assembly protein PilP